MSASQGDANLERLLDAVEDWLLGMTRLRAGAEAQSFRKITLDVERRVAAALDVMERALEMRAAAMRALERRVAELERRAAVFGPPESTDGQTRKEA